jgi:spermidine/putrescine-binding protein
MGFLHSRRTRFVSVIAVATILLAACGNGDDGVEPAADAPSCTLPKGEVTADNQCKFEGRTITVAASPGSLTDLYKQGLGQLFERTTGARINWVGQAPDAVLSQLIAAQGQSPPVDVDLDMYVPAVYSGEEAGVWETFDRSRVPNAEGLPPQAFAGEGRGAATWFNLTGICYNTDRFTSAGLPAPTWDSLTDPRVRSIGFPQPASTRWNLTMVSLAAYYKTGMDNPQPVIDKVKELGDRVTFYSATSEADQLVQSGDAWAVVHADGRCNGLTKSGAPAKLAPMNLNIDGTTYALMLSPTSPEIAKGTKNLDLAYALINTLLTEGALEPLITNLVYTPTVPAVLESLKGDATIGPFLQTDVSTLYSPDTATFREFMTKRQIWVDAWNRTFQ